jgi:hypothetical protein
MAEEEGFEVVDRRRVRADADAPPEPGAETVTDPKPHDEPELTTDPDDDADDTGAADFGIPGFNPFAGINVTGILQMSLGLLSERAWVAMGLVADPATNQVEKDIEEARRAIDVVADLAKHLEPVATPDERRELQRMVTDLRLNFVRQRDAG